MKKTKAKGKYDLKKLLTIGVSTAIGLGFVGSILGVVLGSPELKAEEEEESKTFGVLRLKKASYQTDYFSGDHFSFDKDNSEVTLMAKDPSIETTVKINDLPAPEYGFVVGKTVDQDGNIVTDETLEESSEEIEESSEESTSGEETSSETEKPVYTTTYSDFYLNAEDITMQKDMGTIYLVSKRYQDLRYPLTTNVIGTLDESKLISDVLFEAEDADLYKDGKLLTEEEKLAKPYYANVDPKKISDEDAALLSGNNCLRNLGTDSMKVDFLIASNKETTASLDVKFCLRPNSGLFSSFYTVTINGSSYETIDSQNVSAGPASKYYTPASLASVNITLLRGVNHITFESGSKIGKSNPVNLDAIELKTEENCIVAVKDM